MITESVREKLDSDKTQVEIGNMAGSEKALFLSRLAGKGGGCFLVILPSVKDVEPFINEMNFFSSDRVVYFPPYNILPFKSLSYHTETAAKRIRVLNMLATEKPPEFIVTTVDTVMQRVVPKREIVDYADILMLHEDIEPEVLVIKLIEGGYTRTSLVEEPGDFCVRGGIIDIFSPAHDYPVRAEFFGDTVDSLRFFSPVSQKKTDDITEALIIPAREAIIKRDCLDDIVKRIRLQASAADAPVTRVREIVESVRGESGSSEIESLLPLLYDSMDDLFDYIPADAVVVLDSPEDIRKGHAEFMEKAAVNYEAAIKSGRLGLMPEAVCLNQQELLSEIETRSQIIFNDLPVRHKDGDAGFNAEIKNNTVLRSELKNSHKKENLLQPLVVWLREQTENGYTTIIVSGTQVQAARISELMAPYGIEPHRLGGLPDISGNPGRIFICSGRIRSGFVWPAMNLAVVTEDEIFGTRKKHRRRPAGKKGKEVFSINELKENDYIVHSEHGIGLYQGLEKIKFAGITNDFLKIAFRDDDTLYLPVHRMGVVRKYVGVDDYVPVLNKMGGKSWDKVKEKAKKEIEKIAGDLLKIFAERKVRKGYSFSRPCEYFRDFETGFEYDETDDQLAAIVDVLNDMENDTPMDRLVCGDVGYGKTEVALRAAFKAVTDSKQVAVLVPTTVLAEQHLTTFRQRMEKYPVRVEGLSRFRSRKEQTQIIEDLVLGKVDIVIGTHRLLSKDVGFRDLGLVVIDEEQRFGVKHKEKLKKLRTSVDVLALTATPIPRTLHMSMTGIRDISVISTPPEERQAIITYISEFDDTVITEGIRRELDRKGQIFFVHNNIRTIQKTEAHIRSLVPEVRTGIAHGRMTESELEKVMLSFVNGDIDLLVATTIIESGLDISTANTMFINKADRFGLAQMYQLRGRIGRSDEQAYAYLFIPEESMLTRDARKRLRVLMEHSDLGAGFQIAMSDLQIRGGGAALGASQSGHIAAIGYEMFLSLMESAVADIKGEPVFETLEPEINAGLSSYLPEDYIPEIDQRLILYRRLSSLKEVGEVGRIQEEMVERFGPVPEEAWHVLLKTMLRIMAVKAGVKRLDITEKRLILQFSEIHQKNPRGIIDLIASDPERFEMGTDHSLKVAMPEGSETVMVVRARKFLKELAQHVNG